MSINQTVATIVQNLKKIYEEEFGGKQRGRYKLTRSQFRKLCGRSRLEAAIIQQITNAALDEGFVLIELGDHFCVIEESVLLNFRPVPKIVGVKYLPTERPASANDNEDEDED